MISPRTGMILGSVALHGLLAVAAFFYAGRPKAHKPQSVAVMGEKKKEPPKPDTPPPPPKPRPATRVPEPAPAPLAPAPPPEAPRPVRSTAPAAAGTMSNDGPAAHGSGGGGSGGGGTGTGDPSQPSGPKHAVAEAGCTEQPTKATPVSRPTEIEYTSQARADGIEGRLVLKIIVGADGAVQDVIVVSSVDPALDAAAIAAVKTWVFRPATRCGKPMAGGSFVLAQRFELGD